MKISKKLSRILPSPLRSQTFYILINCIFLVSSYSVAYSASQQGDPVNYPQKIEKIFNGLSKNTLHLVDEFYQTQAHFEDPVGKHDGVIDIKAYYAHQYENVESIRFNFSNHTCQSSDCFSVWTMHLKIPSLNSGKEIVVHGTSVFKFDESGKAIYHRDYFDMGEFVYERIPVLKNIISFIKSKLKPKAE